MPSARLPSAPASYAWDNQPTPAELAQLDAQCFAQAWDAATYRTALANSHIQCWVVRENTPPHPVGWLLVQCIAAEAEILRLGVPPEFRRQHRGRLLLERALFLLAGQGVARVFLEVRASNTAALQLYRGAKFQEVGKRRGYYQDPTEDAVVMARALSTAETRP